MIVTPLGDNVVIKLEKVETQRQTESGIIFNVQGTEQSLREDIATVEAVGEGRTLNNGTVLAPRVKKGDVVIYNKFAGTEVMVEEVKYLILKESDILAITKG